MNTGLVRVSFGRCHLGAALVLLFIAALSPAWAQTKVIIGTGKDPNLGAPFIIAQEKGYFRDAKVDVELKYFPTGGDTIAAFVGGSVQLGSSGLTPTTHLRARPYPVKVVGRVSDISGAQQLIVKQNVKSLQELYGKKIGVMRGTASDALFNSIVKGYGLDAAKFDIVNMGPTEMLQGFVRGAVDAVALWEPHSTRARKTGNGKVLVSATHSFLEAKPVAKRVYGDHSVLFTSESYLKDNAAAVRAVLAALVRADEFIEKNEKEAVALLAKEFNLDAADMSDVMKVNRYTLQLDDEMAGDMNHLAQFLLGLGRIKTAPKAAEWIDPAPLKAVRAELVKLK
ncbi:MAG: ABC transporter substrate-binding protein [Burkholderiales bacterium]|nr:ABC transporter substrate-binding protein [Burkholderiales bacterium]